jgi:hypothetical protein
MIVMAMSRPRLCSWPILVKSNEWTQSSSQAMTWAMLEVGMRRNPWVVVLAMIAFFAARFLLAPYPESEVHSTAAICFVLALGFLALLTSARPDSA